MKTKLLGVVAALGVALLSLSPADADTYNLSGITLSDGGSFGPNSILELDYLSNTIKALNLNTTAGTQLSGAVYVLSDLIGSPSFDPSAQYLLDLKTPLSELQILMSFLFPQGNWLGLPSITEFGSTATRSTTSNWTAFPQPTNVPLPGALPLFATGLGVLGLLGWRRKRKALP